VGLPKSPGQGNKSKGEGEKINWFSSVQKTRGISPKTGRKSGRDLTRGGRKKGRSLRLLHGGTARISGHRGRKRKRKKEKEGEKGNSFSE